MRNDNMTAQFTQPEPVALSMRQPSVPSLPSIPVAEEVVYLPPAHEFLKPVRNPAVVATPVELPAETVNQPAVVAPVIPVGKSKWVPGKAGAFVSVDNSVTAEKSPEKPAADISPVSTENLSRKEQKQLRREKMIQGKQLGDYIPGGAAGGNLNKKQMKALLQKKKQQQNSESNGAGVTASTSATSTGTSISSVTTINSPAKAQPVFASKTKASTLAAAKENAIPSTYANDVIAKAVSKYHAQNEGEHSNSTLFIPSYSSAAAAKYVFILCCSVSYIGLKRLFAWFDLCLTSFSVFILTSFLNIFLTSQPKITGYVDAKGTMGKGQLEVALLQLSIRSLQCVVSHHETTHVGR